MTATIVDVFAAYRLTRLVTADTITNRARERWIEEAYNRAGKAEDAAEAAEATSWTEVAMIDGPLAPKLATLVVCRWCAGWWVAVAVVVARRVAPRPWDLVARALATSAGAALVARLEG